MARRKIPITIDELQDAINQLEAVKPFTSPHKLYEAVAETPWARTLGASAALIYLRIKEANVDPDNPVITTRVRRARHRVGSGDSGSVGVRRARTVTFDGLDTLVDMFRGRGIEITNVEQLLASSTKSDDENRAINLAWSDLRAKLGIPKQARKLGPLAAALAAGEVQIAVPPVPESSISVEPIAEEPITGTAGDPGPGVSSPDVGPVVVTEEMPDGGPVQSQTGVEVGLVGEPGVTSVEPTVSSAPGQVEQVSYPVLVKAVPLPFQMTSVRPVPSRPVPVRSAVLPRPMPVATTR